MREAPVAVKRRPRGFWPKSPGFWKRPRLPRRFWRIEHTAGVLKAFIQDLEEADGTERMKQAALGRAIRGLGGREKVNAADVVWYARILDKTGTTTRGDGHSRAGDYGESRRTTERVLIGEGGRLVIPASLRQAMSLKDGDEVILMLDEGELRLFTPFRALMRAQSLVREHIPADRSLADELIAERRLEASRE